MSRQDPAEPERSPPRESNLFLSLRYDRSPFFEATRRHGCDTYGVYNHMLMPSSYGADPVDDYWHLVEHVTLWDVGVERVVEIRGPDAKAFANYLTPRDLEECEVGQCKYAPLTTTNGGIVNDPVMLHVAEDTFWFCLADSDAGLWMRGLATDTEFDIEITEPDVHPVQVQGPKSMPLMEDLFGSEVTDLDYYRCTETELGEIPVAVSRTGWSAEVGFEVFLRDSRYGEEMWSRLMEAGEEYDIRPTPPSEIRRIEAGIFNYNGDMTIENNPFQLSGMERLVELDGSADFVGRDALERIEREGVDRKLVGVDIDGEIETRITEPWSAYHDGQAVGKVTAATWSPRLERSIGYVWVPVELADPGTSIGIETSAGATHTATTATLPFYASEN